MLSTAWNPTPRRSLWRDGGQVLSMTPPVSFLAKRALQPETPAPLVPRLVA
jgi:hypothetical protein